MKVFLLLIFLIKQERKRHIFALRAIRGELLKREREREKKTARKKYDITKKGDLR